MKTTIEAGIPGKATSVSSYRKTTVVALAAALLIAGSYFAYDKSNSNHTIKSQQEAITAITAEKSELQTKFDASLTRIDEMSTANTQLTAQLEEKNVAIEKAKTEIRSILHKKNLTQYELSKAKVLIEGLNVKVAEMEQTIAQLTEDKRILNEQNVALTTDKINLTNELATTNTAKAALEQKVDIASTLNASNISITPLNVKKSGKEKKSVAAKKVDKMVVNFSLSNRIIQPGVTDLYVLVTGPDGKPVSSGNNFSGVFKTREEGDKFFTAKFPVELETAKTKNVSFSFVPETNDFVQGDYKIQIYQNGFLIGQATSTLKKGILS